MTKKINVAILFGGKSAEHEVSLRSAKNVIEALDKSKFNPILIGIDITGHWLLNENSRELLEHNIPQEIALLPEHQGEMINFSDLNKKQKIDVVFPILHGPFGEDGTVQGLLKLADVPFVGAGVLGSAIGMDKDVMKRLLRDAGLPVGKFITFKDFEVPTYKKLTDELGSPFFIKPANLGSSVGVHKIKNKIGYEKALADAFQYDRKIIAEEFIEGREIECAVLGNEEPIASTPGEIIVNSEFYSYEAKYLDDKGATLQIPAKLSNELSAEIQYLAVQTFKTLCCEGLGRVDFFLKKNGKVLINEINTIPGFTSISMYPKLWEESGLKYSELITRLLELAIERYQKESKLKTARS
ncbi:MAG: D-alanine--D-alanine ligase [Patescibacteria group bacterium]|jgi:D-alanine-D-alanine ligase